MAVQRWNWFMSADVQGKWLSSNGHAEVVLTEKTLNAILRIGPDRGADVFHEISATIDSENYVQAEVSSPGRDIAAFALPGVLFEGGLVEGMETYTVMLTDGTTVLGLTFGPRSHERNM